MRFLKDSTVEDLIEQLENMMHHWHPNRDGSDYRCELCSAEPETDQVYTIIHRDDCPGIRLLDELRNSHDAARAGREPPPTPMVKPIVES